MKIVIIGGVAAGMKAAAKIRRTDPQAEITVVERGSLVSYGACGLPYYVMGEVGEVSDLSRTSSGVLRSPEYFRKVKNIAVLTRTEAMAIDRQAKTVALKNADSGVESRLQYDKLILATGASPVKPPIPGIDLANIFHLRHPDDAEAIVEGLKRGRFNRAVIIGAGLIGMEMAEAFAVWGIEFTVLEMQSNVLPALLDGEIAAIAEKYLRTEGIRIATSEKVVRFVGDRAVTAVLTDKREIPADLVIMAIGVRPNIELAKATGLVIGPAGAIAVDEYLRTSDPDIYAGGDCVENLNIVTGKKVFAPMGSTANKHGRVIAENICGGNAVFRGVTGTSIAKVLDMSIGKSGLTEREAEQAGYDYITVVTVGNDKPHYMKTAKPVTIKLIAEAATRRLLGVQAAGEGDVAKRIDVAAAVLARGGRVEDLFDIDLAYAPPYSSPIDNIAVAASAIINKMAGLFKGITPEQAKEKTAAGQAVFLDVRTPAECKQDRLADHQKVKYIPLEQLRDNLTGLDKGTGMVAFCKIGLRGYEAERILESEGFKDVAVMEGGLFCWPFELEE
jgi:NADPH-dependent 2,4-dienoyl-CoA reductase/sulfur reductase-like enzyme/rhodanese-related sulfurtransferase